MLLTREDVKELTTEEIQEIQEILTEELESREHERLLQIRAELIEIANQHGITPAELLADVSRPGRSRSRLGRTSKIRYQNPENPTQTWAGRGKRPVWLKEKLDEGYELSYFEVDPDTNQENTGDS